MTAVVPRRYSFHRFFDADQPDTEELVIQKTAPSKYKTPMATCITCAGSFQLSITTAL
jgi:hypothetical protein